MAARKKAAEIEETAVEKDGDPSTEGKEGKEAKKTKKAKETTEGTASSEEVLPLEEAFAKLDDIMEQLEQEKISLEDSFLLYQQGMKLLKQCNDSIDRVEKQLIILEEEGI